MKVKTIPDLWLIIPVFALTLISLITLGSIAPEKGSMQVVFTFISLVAFLVFSRIKIEYLIPFKNIIFLGSILFLLTPFIFGIVSRGANSWLQFGQVSLQPSELVKPFLLLTYCYIALAETRAKILKLVALFLLPAVLIFLQPDLGTMVVFGVGWVVILISRLRFKHVLVSAAVLLLMAILLTIFGLKDYQRNRLITFINPYTDPLGSGYHVIQSIIAVGSGGIEGRGLGRGSQSELRFLPENHTDFIFASIAESFGFVGSILVIILYLVYYSRLYKLSQITTDPVASLWLLSCMSMLSFQTLVNIGMNIGMAPVTGITLPFLSYGGSSLLSNTIITALACSISQNNRLRTS